MTRFLSIEMLSAVLNWFLAYQAIRLQRVFQSTAWRLLEAGFVISGIRRVVMLFESWRVEGLADALLVVALALLCLGFNQLHRDLQQIGVKL